MERSVIILGGAGGSGRSTLAKQLESHLGLQRAYGGLRKMVERLGYKRREIDNGLMTPEDALVDFQKNYLPNHPEIDLQLDAQTLGFIQNAESGVVAESMTLGPITKRLGLPFVRVWVDADFELRVKRILKRINESGDTEGTFSAKEVERQLLSRIQNNRMRYQALYGFDFTDTSFYDLVFDTSHIEISDMAKELVAVLRAKGLITKDR